MIFFRPKMFIQIQVFSEYKFHQKMLIFSMISRTFIDGKTVQRQRTRKSATSRFYWYLQYFSTIFLITETDRVGRNYKK